MRSSIILRPSAPPVCLPIPQKSMFAAVRFLGVVLAVTSASLVTHTHGQAIVACNAASARVSSPTLVATTWSPLTVLNDENFESTVLSATVPVVIDFFADYCVRQPVSTHSQTPC